MMKKKVAIIILSICLITASIVYLNRGLFSAELNTNEFNVSVNQPLQKGKLKIYQGLYTINRQSDSEMLKNKGKLIFNGELLNQLENDYGENDFLLIYKDEFYYQFRHFKTWNRQIDNYNLVLSQRNDSIFLDADIKGTDPMVFSRHFNLINNSDSLICNTPISKAGEVYNMKELEN